MYAVYSFSIVIIIEIISYSQNKMNEAVLFRKSQKKDLSQIVFLIERGKQYLKSKGSKQWQSGYPNRETIEGDIEKEQSFVIQIQGKIVGTAALIPGEDQTYNDIQDGKWLTEGNNYLTVHRLCISSEQRGKGLGSIFIKNAEKICKQRGILSIKIDTYPQNKSMLKLISKNGFTQCGYIYKGTNGNVLKVFQKIILPQQQTN